MKEEIKTITPGILSEISNLPQGDNESFVENTNYQFPSPNKNCVMILEWVDRETWKMSEYKIGKAK